MLIYPILTFFHCLILPSTPISFLLLLLPPFLCPLLTFFICCLLTNYSSFNLSSILHFLFIPFLFYQVQSTSPSLLTLSFILPSSLTSPVYLTQTEYAVEKHIPNVFKLCWIDADSGSIVSNLCEEVPSLRSFVRHSCNLLSFLLQH